MLESRNGFVTMPGPSREPRCVIRFGLYEADLAARELRRDGTKIKLQERPFEVLTILIERPGEVVSREEFRQRLWAADTFVDFDSSLNTSVNKLRQALSDHAENPRFIATVGRRGYRFIAPTIVQRDAASVQSAAIVSPPEIPEQARATAPRSHVRMGLVGGGLVILVAVSFLILRLSRQPAPKVLKIVQISHNGHLDPWGRVTSDGARLFYLERAGGQWNVMQVPASGGEAQPFPEPSRNTRFVAISADRSEFLSFPFVVRGPDLPLSLTPVVGGPSQRVGDVIADDAVFGPDGRRIFFTKPDGIYSCDRDGSGIQRLVALGSRSENPRWSKDGKRLRFTLFDQSPKGSSIWEVYADGSSLHPVLANFNFPGEECCGEWSGDGRYFFFDSVRDNLRSIWAIRDDKGSWLSAAPEPVQLTIGPRGRGYGGSIPDGNDARLFVWGGTEDLELMRYNRTSQRVEPVLPGVHSTVVASSSDGSWLSFTSGGTLWKSRADGSEKRSIASGLPAVDTIHWSPDGHRILFHTADASEFGRYFLVSPSGGMPVDVSLGDGQNEAQWSPDGKSLIYAKWPQAGGVTVANSGIYSVDLESLKTAKVPGSEGLIHVSYSPDERYVLAVNSVHLTPGRPATVRLYDTRRREWKDAAQGTLLNPMAWSPDSKYFYYQDILGPNQPVFRHSVASNKNEFLFDFAPLLHAGFTRCGFEGFAPNRDVIVTLTHSDSDLYRFDLDLP